MLVASKDSVIPWSVCKDDADRLRVVSMERGADGFDEWMIKRERERERRLNAYLKCSVARLHGSR